MSLIEFKKIQPGLHVFAWKLGSVGLVWGPRGIRRVELGGHDCNPVTARLVSHFPDLPPLQRAPAPVAALVGRLKSLAAGKADQLLDVPVDLDGCSAFSRAVYSALRKIGPGKVTTYGELAAMAGRPGAARAVGRIMGANPVPLIVPCHRCLGRDGSLTGFSSTGGIELKARLLHFEGYARNPEHARGIAHLRRRDRILRPVIDAFGPYLAVPDKPGPPYDTLVSAIVHQQLSLKAGRTIAGRVRDLTPGPRFPTPQQMLALDPQKLRAAGLSGQKAGYVRDLAARVGDGRLNLRSLNRLSDEEVIATLTTVKGIGVWSAHMHMIFQMGRLDVFPVGDLGVKTAAARLYGLGENPTARQLEQVAETWRPFRSLGAWYLWRSLEAGGM